MRPVRRRRRRRAVGYLTDLATLCAEEFRTLLDEGREEEAFAALEAAGQLLDVADRINGGGWNAVGTC